MKGFQLYESVVMYCQHLYSHIKKKKYGTWTFSQ